MAGIVSGDVKYSHRRAVGRIVAAPAKNPPRFTPESMLASMQPEELRQAMDDLNFRTQSALAQSIGVDRSTVSLWLEGRVGVPRPIAKLVRLMLVHASRENS